MVAQQIKTLRLTTRRDGLDGAGCKHDVREVDAQTRNLFEHTSIAIISGKTIGFCLQVGRISLNGNLRGD